MKKVTKNAKKTYQEGEVTRGRYRRQKRNEGGI